MKSPDKGMLLDFLKGSTATLALFIAYVSLPLAGILPGIYAPLPVLHYTLKSGKGVGLAVVLTVTALLAALAGPLVTLLYIIQSGIMSLSLPLFLERGWGGARSILSSIAISSVVLFAVVSFFWLYRGVDLHGMIVKGIDSSISETVSLYEKGGVKGAQLDTIRQGMKQAGEVFTRIYPAVVIIALGAIAALNLQMLARVAERFSLPLQLGRLSSYRNPEHLIWFVIVPGFSLLVKNAELSMAALNLLIATMSLYFVQGLAVALYLFERHSVPRFIRVMFYVLLALQPYLVIGLVALGLFDLWGNFRTPRQQKNL